MSIKEAQFASRSSHNMEYLAVMAAIFLPLTLFTVIHPPRFLLIISGSFWNECLQIDFDWAPLVALSCSCCTLFDRFFLPFLWRQVVLDHEPEEEVEK
jgi:hypothetical protein